MQNYTKKFILKIKAQNIIVFKENEIKNYDEKEQQKVSTPSVLGKFFAFSLTLCSMVAAV